jgi:hypothetical protein
MNKWPTRMGTPTWMGGSVKEQMTHADGNGILGAPTGASGALSPMSHGGGVEAGHETH